MLEIPFQAGQPPQSTLINESLQVDEVHAAGSEIRTVRRAGPQSEDGHGRIRTAQSASAGSPCQTTACGRKKIRIGPSGVHLFDRGSGLNVLFDEFVPPISTWARAPRSVSIALTNACDLSCAYCFITKTRATLDFDKIVAWLDELDSNGAIGVGFGGGEPTLYRRFAELCTHTTKNTGLAVTFTTHGHLLDDTLLTALKGSVHFTRVSMDGVGATYERLRGRPFSVLLKRLAALSQIVPFGINYVVNADTLPDINAAAILAEKIGASEFLILPEQPVNGQGGNTNHISEELRAWVRSYSGGMRLTVSERGSEGMSVCDPFPLETGLREYAHIDAYGVLKKTSFDCEGVSIGPDGIMSSLTELHRQTGGERHESLA